jgi:glycosyltransferase involved in cell wall biosynthesis
MRELRTDPKRLVCMTTAPNAAYWHMRGQLKWMKDREYDVTLITSPGPEFDWIGEREGVRVIPVPMAREINPQADAVALPQLIKLFRELKPDVLNAGTPKASLLGLIAGQLTGIPVRIYTLRGLRLETATGVKRTILTRTERISAACAHEVVCVSGSLRTRALELKLAPAWKTVVLGGGSSNGVDVERFRATPALLAEAATLRETLALPDGAFVIGFVGRFTKDKGIIELFQAFESLYSKNPLHRLLLVGDFEEGDPIPTDVREKMLAHPGVIRTGFVQKPDPYFHLIDVLAFPSYREGLPNVPLQAAAAGKPAVGFAATGVVDAIVDGQTGLIVPVADAVALESALARYRDDPALRTQHGEAAMDRALTLYRPEAVWSALDAEYRRLWRANVFG